MGGEQLGQHVVELFRGDDVLFPSVFQGMGEKGWMKAVFSPPIYFIDQKRENALPRSRYIEAMAHKYLDLGRRAGNPVLGNEKDAVQRGAIIDTGCEAKGRGHPRPSFLFSLRGFDMERNQAALQGIVYQFGLTMPP